ncbi:MAG: LytR C-terminal domain-containing protein [Ilumatobacteraceae bacterium]
MSQDAPRPRRTPPSVPSSVNSTMSIVIAAVALLLGFVILRDIQSNSDSSSGDPNTTETTVGDTVPTDATTTTTILLTAFKVQVANASKVAGSAGQLTVELQGRGYIVQPALNASDITPKQTTTVVYFLPGSEAAAAAVATELGGVATAPMPTPVPTETGQLGEASVLILLGTDLAGKPLSSSVPTSAPPVTTTTVA